MWIDENEHIKLSEIVVFSEEAEIKDCNEQRIEELCDQHMHVEIQPSECSECIDKWDNLLITKEICPQSDLNEESEW